MKAWQKIVLGAGAGLVAAYVSVKGCSTDDIENLVRSAHTSSDVAARTADVSYQGDSSTLRSRQTSQQYTKRLSPAEQQQVMLDRDQQRGASSYGNNEYSCVCNCPPVNLPVLPYESGRQQQCPPCPSTEVSTQTELHTQTELQIPTQVQQQCPTCPTCPACPQCPEQERCETVDQLIDRIAANDEHYTALIRKIVQNDPCVVIRHLPTEMRERLGRDYIRGRVRSGVDWMRDGLHDLFEGGARRLERW